MYAPTTLLTSHLNELNVEWKEREREKHLNKLLDKTDQSSRLMKRTQNITRNEAIIANLIQIYSVAISIYISVKKRNINRVRVQKPL